MMERRMKVRIHKMKKIQVKREVTERIMKVRMQKMKRTPVMRKKMGVMREVMGKMNPLNLLLEIPMMLVIRRCQLHHLHYHQLFHLHYQGLYHP